MFIDDFHKNSMNPTLARPNIRLFDVSHSFSSEYGFHLIMPIYIYILFHHKNLNVHESKFCVDR